MNYINLEERLTFLYNLIIEEGGIIDFPWCSDRLFYPYYLHMDDKNHDYRSGALIAFMGLLSEWDDGSGFPFCRNKQTANCYEFD